MTNTKLFCTSSLIFQNEKCYIFDASTKINKGGKKQKEGGGKKREKKGEIF